MNIKYSGYFDAPTGMGEACRNIIASLYEAKVEVTTELVPNLVSRKSLGTSYEIASSLHARDIDYTIKIIHITPDWVHKHLEPLKYHIFHLFWETDKLPAVFVWALNHSVDEIWTGDEYHKKVFLDSGVKLPIWVCPQPIYTNKEIPKKFVVCTEDGYGHDRPINKDFLFYSIFQWIERKDWKSLITAYWKEFQGGENVGLLLKIFKERFTFEETDNIIKDILRLKKEIPLNYYPKIYLFTNEISRNDIYRFHSTGDCFITTHRGEGWGIPIVEAMLMGRPVITTNIGGIHEYIPRDCAYLVNFDYINVFNMEWCKWYDTAQKWAQIDINDLRAKMRYVFTNREQARYIGKKAREFVMNEFNLLTVGNRMKLRLEEIQRAHQENIKR